MDLRELRKSRKFLIKEVAYKIGVSNRTLCAWEAGDRNVTVGRLLPYSKALSVTIEQLIDAISETQGGLL